MTSLLKKAILSNPCTARKTVGIFCNAVRNHWNYQYKPGPYPRTVEERAAAAKKYGLTPEEYQPYPEDMGYGDYPKLPDIGADSKDPTYPYDSPELKRNFNEPVKPAKPTRTTWYCYVQAYPVPPYWTVGSFPNNTEDAIGIHAKAEIYGEDRYDISMKPRFSVMYQWSVFLGVLGAAFTLYLYLEDYKIGRPVTAKQYPNEGPHYLFAPK